MRFTWLEILSRNHKALSKAFDLFLQQSVIFTVVPVYMMDCAICSKVYYKSDSAVN